MMSYIALSAAPVRRRGTDRRHHPCRHSACPLPRQQSFVRAAWSPVPGRLFLSWSTRPEKVVFLLDYPLVELGGGQHFAVESLDHEIPLLGRGHDDLGGEPFRVTLGRQLESHFVPWWGSEGLFVRVDVPGPLPWFERRCDGDPDRGTVPGEYRVPGMGVCYSTEVDHDLHEPLRVP